MKAFILAAGNGTRLHPLTARIPKCLVPIRGVPLLKIWLDICGRYGIDEVTVNLHAQAAKVRDYVESCVTPVRVRLFEEPTLLGSAGTLRSNADWVGPDENFFVFYGDVLTTLDIGRMYRYHHSKGMPVTIALHHVDNPSQCGIASLNANGIVQAFVEKPAKPSGTMGFCGVMVANAAILQHIPAGAVDIGYDLLPRLTGSMAGYVAEEYLTDIGTLAAYDAAQLTWPGLYSLPPACQVPPAAAAASASGDLRR